MLCFCILQLFSLSIYHVAKGDILSVESQLIPGNEQVFQSMPNMYSWVLKRSGEASQAKYASPLYIYIK